MIDRLYIAFHIVDSLLLVNCKMEWKTGSFYKVRNKGDKKRKYLIGWDTELTFFGARRPRVGLVFGGWLIGPTEFLVRWKIYRT